jgi:FAD/FMN-containing dehydrogenases
LGIITEAWVRLRQKPTFRASASVRFKNFFAGADAVRAITQAGLYPANCRLLEAREALPGIPWSSEEAVLVLAFESADHPLDAWMKRALEICDGFGGVPDQGRRRRRERPSLRRRRRLAQPLHPRPALWRARRGARHPLLDLRDLDDVGAHARLPSEDHHGRPRHDQARDRPRRHDHLPLHPRLSRRAVPLFHVGGILDKRKQLEQFMDVLSTCTAATVEHGGTTTHHHAVGRFHRPFYDKQRPELFAKALRGAKRELDPKGMMNPGVLIDP